MLIFENKDFLVINKPAGLMVHGDGKSDEVTLCDLLLDKFPEIKRVGEPLVLENGTEILRSGIVHRLDKETSGIMIVARNSKSFDYLKSEFKNREIKKTYHAFIYGNIKEDRGVIDEPIGRSKRDFRQWTTGKLIRGEVRPAITQFTTLKRGEGFSYLICRPKTGRTHQIRVHMKYLHHPVVADNLYAPEKKPTLGFKRLALHAYELEFKDLKGKTLKFQAPFPEDFIKARKKAKISNELAI
jgi:23S rRNA pseudouridine1911/1915/1917 synthase